MEQKTGIDGIRERFCSLLSKESICEDTWPILRKWSVAERAPHKPAILLRPTSEADVVAIVQAAGQAGCAVTTLGALSGVVGAALPSEGSVCLDMTALSGVRRLNMEDRTVTVSAGTNGGELESFLNERGFTCGHYPQSLHLSTVAGWVCTKGTGTFSNKYGGIEHLVTALRAVLPDGSIYASRDVPRSAAGPRLDHLFVGSEGIFGVLTEVTLNIFKLANTLEYRSYRFPDISDGLKSAQAYFDAHTAPALMRLYDAVEADHLYQAAGLATGGALMILGHEGHSAVVQAEAAVCEQISQANEGEILGGSVGQAWDAGRYHAEWLEEGNDTPFRIADSIEIAANWSRLAILYRNVMHEISDVTDSSMAHFSHFYPNGSMFYVIFQISDENQEQLAQRYYRSWEIVLNNALKNSGTITHHHGVGLIRRPWLKKELGDTGYRLLQSIKSTVDPSGLLNPGKLDADCH